MRDRDDTESSTVQAPLLICSVEENAYQTRKMFKRNEAQNRGKHFVREPYSLKDLKSLASDQFYSRENEKNLQYAVLFCCQLSLRNYANTRDWQTLSQVFKEWEEDTVTSSQVFLFKSDSR